MVLCMLWLKVSSRKNADGTLKYGLIDSINKLIKDNNTGSTYTDDPYNTTTPFNKVVKQITGYDCIESLRKRYVEELQQGTWTFKKDHTMKIIGLLKILTEYQILNINGW